VSRQEVPEFKQRPGPRLQLNSAEARSMAQLARDAGMTRAGLYKALSAQGNPRIETAQRIARALGLELTLRPAP